MLDTLRPRTIPMKAPLLAALSGLLLASCSTPAPVRPPQLAGQAVPDENIVIDFRKRYNLVCEDAGTSRTYSSCRVLGYTGDTVRDADGSMKSNYGHFGRWLAVQLPGGRRVFMSPSSIQFLEEAP
jgi:hypothetical protein